MVSSLKRYYVYSLLFILSMSISYKGFSQGKMVPQIGNQEGIVYMETSSDGKWLATGGRDRVVLLWDLQKGYHWTLTGHSFVISGVTFNPESTLLATSDGRGKILIWDIASKQIKFQKDLKQDVGDIHFIPGTSQLSYSTDRVALWDYKTDRITPTSAVQGDLLSQVSISPNGQYRVSTVKSLNFVNGKLVTNYNSEIYDLKANRVLSPSSINVYGREWIRNSIGNNGKYLALADVKSIVIQDFKTGKLIRRFSFSASPSYLHLTKNGETVVAGYENGIVVIGDVASGKMTKVSSIVGSEIPAGIMAYDETQNRIIGVDNTFYTVKTYDVASQQVIREFTPKSIVAWNLVWNEDKKQLFVDNKSLAGKYSYDENYGRSLVVWDLNALNIVDHKPYRPATGLFENTTSAFDQRQKRSLLNKTTIRRVNKSKELSFYKENSTVPFKTLKSDKVITGFTLSLDETKLFVANLDQVLVYSFPSLTKLKEHEYLEGAPYDMLLSQNGKYVAVGKTAETVGLAGTAKPLEFNIDIYSVQTGDRVKVLKGHYSTITDLEFTKDGRLFSSAYDGTIRLWDIEKGEEIALLHGIDKSYYFVLANNGYYTLSKSAIDKVAYATSSSIYPASQFEIKFNRPDKVAESIQYTSPLLMDAYKKAYQKRIQKLGIRETELDLDNLPKVSITSTVPTTTSEKTMKLSINASDVASGLDFLSVKINNVPVLENQGLDLKGSKEINKTITVELSSGANYISIEAVNNQGLSSAPAIANVNCNKQVKPDLYLMAIGVSKFADADYNLTYAAKDANDLASFFRSRKGDYNDIFIKQFSDYKATKDNILSASDFFSSANVDDEVIIFTASHGLLDDQLDYYIATSDMIFENPSFKGLKYEELEKMFTKSKARNRLLMIDACHSGEVDKESVTVATNSQNQTSAGVKSRGFKKIKSTSNELGLKNSFEMMKELFADMRSGTGATVISSAAGTEFALESDQWQNGVFTYAVLNGLKSDKADIDKDDYISVTELKTYVFAEVEKLTNGKQHPTSRIENLKNDFVVTSTANASVAKFETNGVWVENYQYYGDKRQRYFEIFRSGNTIDVYSEGMSDHDKKWKRSSEPIKYAKVAPNKYKSMSNAYIEFLSPSKFNYNYGYGDNFYEKTDKIIRPQTSVSQSTTRKTYNSTPVRQKTVAKTYPHEWSGTWKRADGKKDSSGKTYSADIAGLANGGIQVKFSHTGKTFNYQKAGKDTYEYKLGSLTFTVEKNKDGSLMINKKQFKK